MKKTNNYFLIIAGVCVFAAGIAFSVHQAPASSLSDDALAGIAVGCSWTCTTPSCTKGDYDCTENVAPYCSRRFGEEDQDKTECIDYGGTWEGCARWDEALCYTFTSYLSHPTYGCEPNGEGDCQGSQNGDPGTADSYGECGECTW